MLGRVEAPSFEPPPPPPLPPPAPSAGLRLLGIAQCALGAFGLLAAPITVITRVVAQDAGSRRVQELLWEGWLGAWTWTSLVLGTLLAVTLIAAGVGVVRGMRWGRSLTLAHGVLAILHVVSGQVVSVVFLYPALWALGTGGNAAERGGAVGGVIGGFFGSLVALVLPVIELWVMTRPSVRETYLR
jgi:hypothetical protein